MDFLDPRKRKRQRLRLSVGYILMTIAISLISVILIYGAYGYGINTKTGQIIQNGLLFVGSHPGGAQIYLNGKYQATTASRLILPAGRYSLGIKKTGYRDWQRSFSLDEHGIARFTYPLLFPTKAQTTSLKNYTSMPPLITQSPDQHWLLVQNPDASKLSFDEYDTTNLTKEPQSLDVPADVLSGGDSGQLSLVEWSTDNKDVLLRHDFAGGYEFIIFNRATPTDSLNVNKLFSANPTSVALKNKKIGQLYIYDQNQATLSVGNISTGAVSPVLSQVLAFKPYGNNLILYVSDKSTPPGDVSARIWDNGQTYSLYSFQSGAHYLIDYAQYNGHWYYVAGSDASPRVNIYQDPLSDIQNPAIDRAIPLLSLNLADASKVSFSNTAQYIEADDGQNFSVYDILNQDSYAYKLAVPLAAPLSWMDGNRLIGDSGGKVYVIDYDAANAQLFVPTVEIGGGFFSSDFNHLLTIQMASGTYQLINVDMRAGADLPKTSPGSNH